MNLGIGETEADVRQQLSEARAALHKLMTGAQAASVNYPNGSVSYTKADIPSLRSYIAELEAKLGGRRRRPLIPYVGGHR